MTITLTREEAQQVLDAFVNWDARGRLRLIETLRARLAQPELPQRTGDCLLTGVCAAEGHRIQKARPEPEPAKLLLIPALMEQAGWVRKREWQGLTDEDLSVCDEDGVILARYWEAKLKEKNA